MALAVPPAVPTAGRGIPLFDSWAGSKLAKTFDLTWLKDCTIGIDAAYFLESLRLQEPLLSGLGGSLALESLLIKAVRDMQSFGLSLHFVFDGLDTGNTNDSIAESKRASELATSAFEQSGRGQSSLASQTFKAAGFSDTTTLFEIMKKTLHEIKVPFIVAPYSALGQLVYLEQSPSQFIDAVLGSSELFCFGIDKVITRISPETSQFTWIKRQDCLDELGNVPVPTFVDILLLAGSNILPQFPPISNLAVYPKGPSIRLLTELLASCGGSGARLCATDPVSKLQDMDAYFDRYKRALTIVRHHVVITAEGDVGPLNKERAPDDTHLCIGVRLPEELYMYLSRGMVRPRVLNWLTTGTVLITQPLAGGDSEVYQDLVKTKLDPLRRQALSLLSEPIHRYYHTIAVTTRLSFDLKNEGLYNMKEQPLMKDLLSSWNVKLDSFKDVYSEDTPPGTLQFAMAFLENKDYAASSVSSKPKAGQELLKDSREILANVVYRFLQLRGYVNEKHQLTPWGKVLQEALNASGMNRADEEAAFIAVELLRLGLLNPDTMFLGYSGAPGHGTNIDMRNAMLVSRIACLGKIRHEQKPYSGTLSRHLLAYQSMTSSIRSSLRDLLEMTLVALFLEGLVDRDRDDWMDLSLRLPFQQEQTCALGVLTLHYLDDLAKFPNPTSRELQSEIKTKCQHAILYSDFSASLEKAFNIWDSVYKAVKVAGDKVNQSDREMWKDVNGWLLQRK